MVNKCKLLHLSRINNTLFSEKILVFPYFNAKKNVFYGKGDFYFYFFLVACNSVSKPFVIGPHFKVKMCEGSPFGQHSLNPFNNIKHIMNYLIICSRILFISSHGNRVISILFLIKLHISTPDIIKKKTIWKNKTKTQHY